MGSDSSNATATSAKPRPKWRDRHLKQLSSEQLKEVSEHRGETSLAENFELEDTQPLNYEASAQPQNQPARQLADNLPRRQAGPDQQQSLDRPSNTRETAPPEPVEPRERQPERAPERVVDQQKQPYTGQAHREPAHEDTPREQYREQRQREQARRPRPRFDDYRESPQNRNFEEYDTVRGSRDYYERVEADYRHEPARQHRQEYRANRRPERRPQYRSENRPQNRLDTRPDNRQDYRPASRDNITPSPARQEHAQPLKESRQQPAAQEDVSAAAAQDKPVRGFAKLLQFKFSASVKYGLIAFAIAAMVAVSFLKPIDNSSQSQLDSAMTRAMIGFGLARTLNGVISVAQGTEFAVQPAGVGVNFSPGEILDPINDLVERFSWVMLLATSSLGVQQILLEVSSWMGISVLLAGAAVFFLLTRIRNSSIAALADVAGKILLVMLLVRFLIPLGSLANDWVYRQFLQPEYEQSSQQLEIASEKIREISTRQAQPEEAAGSLRERAKNLYDSMTAKFDFDGMLNDYKQSAENVSEHAVNLIVVFLLQTVVFPLLFLYLIYRLFRSVMLPARSRN